MIVVYEVYTPYMGHARTIATKRAAAEGWSRATVTAVHKIALNTYEVTLTVFK